MTNLVAIGSNEVEAKRVLGAMVRLQNFSEADLERSASVSKATVRSVLQTVSSLFRVSEVAAENAVRDGDMHELTLHGTSQIRKVLGEDFDEFVDAPMKPACPLSLDTAEILLRELSTQAHDGSPVSLAGEIIDCLYVAYLEVRNNLHGWESEELASFKLRSRMVAQNVANLRIPLFERLPLGPRPTYPSRGDLIRAASTYNDWEQAKQVEFLAATARFVRLKNIDPHTVAPTPLKSVMSSALVLVSKEILKVVAEKLINEYLGLRFRGQMQSLGDGCTLLSPKFKGLVARHPGPIVTILDSSQNESELRFFIDCIESNRLSPACLMLDAGQQTSLIEQSSLPNEIYVPGIALPFVPPVEGRWHRIGQKLGKRRLFKISRSKLRRNLKQAPK
jgi:hypothetical protein